MMIDKNIPIPVGKYKQSKQLKRWKTTASQQLRYAVKHGHIFKPNKCEVCNKTTRINGHHADYNYPLDVIWCCTTCHSKIHKYCEVII